MFISLYFYRIPKNQIDEFIRIQKKSAEIYRKYGAVDDWTFGAEDLTSKYGCDSFLNSIRIEPTESLFLSLSQFVSREEHDRVMALVDCDPEIANLFEEACIVMDISRVIRGEFNRLV